MFEYHSSKVNFNIYPSPSVYYLWVHKSTHTIGGVIVIMCINTVQGTGTTGDSSSDQSSSSTQSEGDGTTTSEGEAQDVKDDKKWTNANSIRSNLLALKLSVLIICNYYYYFIKYNDAWATVAIHWSLYVYGRLLKLQCLYHHTAIPLTLLKL